MGTAVHSGFSWDTAGPLAARFEAQADDYWFDRWLVHAPDVYLTATICQASGRH